MSKINYQATFGQKFWGSESMVASKKIVSEGASIKDILELRAKDNYSPSVLDFSSNS